MIEFSLGLGIPVRKGDIHSGITEEWSLSGKEVEGGDCLI